MGSNVDPECSVDRGGMHATELLKDNVRFFLNSRPTELQTTKGMGNELFRSPTRKGILGIGEGK